MNASLISSMRFFSASSLSGSEPAAAKPRVQAGKFRAAPDVTHVGPRDGAGATHRGGARGRSRGGRAGAEAARGIAGEP